MKKITIYSAADLCNARETLFNLELIGRLERKGYEVLLPQREGFEFGRLTGALEGKISQEEMGHAVQLFIYFLDMGLFIPKSDVVIANLDEPQDAGVVVEISHAKLMGKLVIGYRTDVRSPYGSIDESLGGIHFFPAFQCDFFIRDYLPCRREEEKKQGLNRLAGKIDETIKKQKIAKKELPQYALENPSVKKVISGARLLFKGISDIHSGKGLEEIARRYVENQGSLEEIYPKIR